MEKDWLKLIDALDELRGKIALSPMHVFSLFANDIRVVQGYAHKALLHYHENIIDKIQNRLLF